MLYYPRCCIGCYKFLLTLQQIHMADRHYPQGGKDFFGRNFRPLGAQQRLK